ncbi:fimbrial protein [Variovorax robiniae]|uniref:Fimbrial protein n=1 Tax=Variovorax robiniae TaxID=1836199 RepID=A0ABU8X9F3_9BURK
MKSKFAAIAIATSLLGLASIGAHAADGTITITGTVTDSTCSINGIASGAQADKAVVLPTVSAGSLATNGATAGTSSPTDLNFSLSGCTGPATKAIASFENGTNVDQTTGNLKNTASTGPATNVQVRLLNSSMQPINLTNNSNNTLASNAATITSGNALLKYFAQYFATGKATSGAVNTSVQYTMQYQ